jgi:hypothetical protein
MKHVSIISYISIWCLHIAVACANGAGQVSATKASGSITIESTGGLITYKAVVDTQRGGDISDFRLPASGDIVGRELNDIFFLGTHGEEYTLRGWTGPNKFTISCSADVISQKPNEVVVQVNLLTTGTFKILVDDPAAKAKLRKLHASYKDRTTQIKRIYTFKPDRIVVNDELTWLHPNMQFRTFYFTSAFTPGYIQGPARLVKDGNSAGFEVTGSGGKKVPTGISYPFTTENFLKSGYKISQRTAATSFDVGTSDFYYYEKPWQQDWDQLAGFMYKLPGYAPGQSITFSHELVFSKVTAAEMPPVVTIQSPGWDTRWMDENGEVPKFKIGDTVKLVASAVNSDGSAVPSNDIRWEIHIDPWWNTPAATLRGSNLSYTLPDVVNEEDKTKSKDRKLLAVITVRAKGKNGTEAVEPFATLVGKAAP